MRNGHFHHSEGVKPTASSFHMGFTCTYHIEVQNVTLLLPQKALWVILIDSRGRGKYGFKASSASCFVTMEIKRHSQEEQCDFLYWHGLAPWF